LYNTDFAIQRKRRVGLEKKEEMYRLRRENEKTGRKAGENIGKQQLLRLIAELRPLDVAASIVKRRCNGCVAW